MAEDFFAQVGKICEKDPRYRADAYEFMMHALFFTQKQLKREGHVSAQELLNGIKKFALEQFGPLSHAVLEYWGINSTDDFGHIVFNMVENGLLKKTEDDNIEDFKGVYDLKKEFEIGYRRHLEKQIKEGRLNREVA